MAVLANSPSQRELINWCKGESVDLKHAFLLHGVPEGVSREDIEETAGTIKAWGRVRVRGKMFHHQQQSLMVLCECREEIDPSKIPPEIMPISGGSSWKTVCYTEPQLDNFEEKLLTFLQSEGRTLEDIQGLRSPTKESNSNPEDIIRAVGDVMSRTNKQPDSHPYRRLRTFSGISPTPTGEETLDNWLEQATLLVEEGECSDKEKRRRILESLKGPAFEIIQAVRLTQPDASPREYIEAIESIFGTLESSEELYLSFRALHQQPGERLSEFLRRVERSLVKVVQGGGLPVSAANSTRLEQLLRGSTSELMLLQLKIRERSSNPPTFLNLLREVMEEEGRQSARQSQVSHLRPQRVRTVQAEKEKEPESVSRSELQARIQELRAQLEQRTNPQPQPPSDESFNGLTEKQKQRNESQSELQSLRKQVKALESKMSVMAVKYTSEQTPQPHRYKAATGYKPAHSRVSSPRQDNDEFFCYRCGENGHIATRCTAPENLQKVIRKLIRLARVSPLSHKENPQPAAEEHCVARTNKVEVPENNTDSPEGLVGPSFIHTIKVNDVVCDALIDSGSNVTIIFESWYNKHLLDVPIKPLSGLGLWGLADTEYPYKGYVVVEMEFSEEITGVTGRVEVLALVCPEPRNQQQTPVLVGTNTSLFRRLWELAKTKGDENTVYSMRIQSVYAPVKAQEQSTKNEVLGQIKWKGPGSLAIAPGAKYYATCKVERQSASSKDLVLIDAPTDQLLPTGLLVQPGVLSDADIDNNSFTVLIQNESKKTTSIPVGTVVAEMYAVDTVTPVRPSDLTAETIDPNHLLPIGYMVRLSNQSDDTNSARRPVTRAQLTRKHLSTKSDESDTESSGSEFETVHNPPDFDVDEVRKQLDMINQPVEDEQSQSSEESENSEEDEQFEEENCEAAEIQQLTETEYEEQPEGAAPPLSHSYVQETYTESAEDLQDSEEGAGSPLLNRARRDKAAKSARSESERSSTIRKSLRKPKPSMRFTYEKPGHPSCEPVTIMHHGMVIQLKLNPPNQDNESRKKSKTSKRYMEEENKKHSSKLKRDKRCDEDIYTFRRGRV
ncbi:Paraneoplastic antigen Ma2 [Merluccius polli]|uniref:Paraneoplastic antigen Ma2 n=1 Tax=Merluccius polli TaxID=89951 RepID=A0AA47MB04_MERPO|nr:Paraneoplastic antigen Ma2 [Merluccius polli]